MQSVVGEFLAEAEIELLIPKELSGKRLDVALATLCPDYSRARLQQWIKAGEVTINREVVLQPRSPVVAGMIIALIPKDEVQGEWLPEPMDLDIYYEDEDLLVINKPVGLVVHPAAGHWQGTLLNGLLHHCPSLIHIPRAGIVHRLDKETSGLLMVAKRLSAHASLVDQLQQRSVLREYQAVVHGALISGGVVDAPIGRHAVDRKKMAVISGGREAVTHYRIEQRYAAFTQLRVRLETGRTHQIRVHMAHIHHPLVGDPLYGGRQRYPPASSAALLAALDHYSHQALHAGLLGIIHPQTGESLSWRCDPPADFQTLVAVLQAEAAVA
ncbi:MAG: 23S rRNA pseudouridine(1911/1915/1917) synthase RluD [Gammaproteobacteria bacterium]|nr:23S rRNA pseudouridine(1911/1915/1917) synthase RluD [Gammaproteobacteria bacterium]